MVLSDKQFTSGYELESKVMYRGAAYVVVGITFRKTGVFYELRPEIKNDIVVPAGEVKLAFKV